MNNGESPKQLRIQANALLSKARKLERKRHPSKRYKKKALRNSRIAKAENDLISIQKVFSGVQCFSKIHLRIEGVLDVWPTTGRFYNRATYEKGIYLTMADLVGALE